MKTRRRWMGVAASLGCGVLAWTASSGAAAKPPPGGYSPVVPKETFAETMKRMKAERPEIERRQAALLEKRYDLADHAARGVKMSRGKPVQAGVRVKLKEGTSWNSLASMTPEQVRDQ